MPTTENGTAVMTVLICRSMTINTVTDCVFNSRMVVKIFCTHFSLFQAAVYILGLRQTIVSI